MREEIANNLIEKLENYEGKVVKPKAKHIKKSPTSFNVSLTAEQKEAKKIALNNVVTILTGKAGTSKTLLSCNIALDLLIQGAVSKILITRPAVEIGKTQGYLPGDPFNIKEGKMAPFIAPVIQAMNKLKDPKQIEDLIKKGAIQIVPINFVRGLNFEDCVVIVDESQNITKHELKALTTRICEDAYMIFTSDLAQIDLYNKANSAGYLFEKISKLEGVGTFELKENFRSPLALTIMELVEKEEKEEKENENKAK